jgi:hypothetical protein
VLRKDHREIASLTNTSVTPGQTEASLWCRESSENLKEIFMVSPSFGRWQALHFTHR